MKSMEDAWQWTSQDHILNTLPLHHVHGIMNILNTSLWAGARCTMIPKFDDRAIWDLLLTDDDGLDINIFMGVPTVYKKLIDKYEKDNMAADARKIRQ